MINNIISGFFKLLGIPVGSIITAIQTVLLGFTYILEFIYNIADIVILNTDKLLLNLLPDFVPFSVIRGWGEDQLIKILEKREAKIAVMKKAIKA